MSGSHRWKRVERGGVSAIRPRDRWVCQRCGDSVWIPHEQESSSKSRPILKEIGSVVGCNETLVERVMES
jgi:hypothetical protein